MLVVKEEVLTSQLLGCKLEIHRRHPSCTHASSPWKPPASKTGKLCIWKIFHILCILERQNKHMKAKQKPLWFLLVHAKSKTRHQKVQRLWRPPPGFIANHSHAACSVVKGVLSAAVSFMRALSCDQITPHRPYGPYTIVGFHRGAL